MPQRNDPKAEEQQPPHHYIPLTWSVYCSAVDQKNQNTDTSVVGAIQADTSISQRNVQHILWREISAVVGGEKWIILWAPINIVSIHPLINKEAGPTHSLDIMTEYNQGNIGE